MVAAAQQTEQSGATDTELWAGLDRLLDRADAAGLRTHSLQVPAADRWRAQGRPVPADFDQLERLSVARLLAVPVVLERLRAAVDGPIIVHKGPEVAALYPDPPLRTFDDVDVMVADPVGVQRALVGAGFVEIGDPAFYSSIQHLRPLEWSGLPLRVEVHGYPKWPGGLVPPCFEELLEAALPSSTGVEGVLAPSPAHHVLILAAHGWAHAPLRRLRDLLDVAAAAQAADLRDVLSAARSWQAGRLWRTTYWAADAVFRGGPTTFPLRTWARHLPHIRERSVIESHAARLLAGFSLLPPASAARAAADGLLDLLLPAAGETWVEKLTRAREAVGHAFRPRTEHDQALGGLARRPQRRQGRNQVGNSGESRQPSEEK